ncbi:transcription termination factor Rho [bacterium]|nr:transcription termination factor Rho [bacterium]MCI0605364.1 transcription termination factor Rho [bacterium]
MRTHSNRRHRPRTHSQQHAPRHPHKPSGPPQEVSGILEVLPTGIGFLRKLENDLMPSEEDAFISSSMIRQKVLRSGMTIRAMAGDRKAVTEILEIIGSQTSEEAVPFDRQISIDPEERFVLTPASTSQADRSMRLLELMTPIGKGQRALIVAPPRTGKTTLLMNLASSVAAHHPETHLVVLLVDERPEEVTHFKRSVRGSVIASSSDKEAKSHLRIARLTLEYVRMLAESGKDVFLLLDSLTRLGRASNREEQNRGKTLSGGIGSRALEFPRRFFGSARNLEHGGSLTIVATALIDTGSRMDEVIFQEFKGTGNMELVLNRRIADRRIFPAVDLSLSGTRKEEKILPPEWLIAVHKLRRHLSTLKPDDALEVLLERLQKAENVQAFCESLA